MAFVKQGGQWVPCVVVQTKGAKSEVVVKGYTFVVFNENVSFPEAVAA